MNTQLSHSGSTTLSAAADALWSLAQVIAVTSLSRSTIYSYVKQGLFPAPVRVGVRCSRWSANQVMQWVFEQVGTYPRPRDQ